MPDSGPITDDIELNTTVGMNNGASDIVHSRERETSPLARVHCASTCCDVDPVAQRNVGTRPPFLSLGLSFFIFGLINNVLYVIILSAALDLVPPSTPKVLSLHKLCLMS